MLGVQLFDRHAGGVSATAAGRKVIAEALLTVSQSERVTAAAQRHRRGDWRAAGGIRGEWCG
ncbi:hypothetical protein [Streptomyces sp. NBC_00057]|uniref:hypothetical protein n=1 Tax=Streptomyces sp. NBC_00057 TaxID=2975634 RepID=UPI003248F935